MKKILILLCSLLLSVSLVGCAELISTETKNVEVVVTDVYHKPTIIVPMMVGKVMTTSVQPAYWTTYIEYDGVEYSIGGSDTYNKFKDKVGQTVTGVLEIRTYDDGSIKYDIVGLEVSE